MEIFGIIFLIIGSSMMAIGTYGMPFWDSILNSFESCMKGLGIYWPESQMIWVFVGFVFLILGLIFVT